MSNRIKEDLYLISTYGNSLQLFNIARMKKEKEIPLPKQPEDHIMDILQIGKYVMIIYFHSIYILGTKERILINDIFIGSTYKNISIDKVVKINEKRIAILVILNIINSCIIIMNLENIKETKEGDRYLHKKIEEKTKINQLFSYDDSNIVYTIDFKFVILNIKTMQIVKEVAFSGDYRSEVYQINKNVYIDKYSLRDNDIIVRLDHNKFSEIHFMNLFDDLTPISDNEFLGINNYSNALTKLKIDENKDSIKYEKICELSIKYNYWLLYDKEDHKLIVIYRLSIKEDIEKTFISISDKIKISKGIKHFPGWDAHQTKLVKMIGMGKRRKIKRQLYKDVKPFTNINITRLILKFIM